jgi:hypothetical protein
MKNKCIIVDRDVFTELPFLNENFRLKVLTKEESEMMSEDYVFGTHSYNPFGEPPFWAVISKLNLNEYSRHIRDSKGIYKKIILLNEFKCFDTEISCNEFEYNFFEKGRESLFASLRSQIVRNPKIESWDFGPRETERFGDFIKRIKERFKSDFVYIVTFMISKTLEVDFECKELPPRVILNNNPDMPPKSVWNETILVRDKSCLPSLKALVIEIVQKFEDKNINYIILPDTLESDIVEEMDRQDSLSWGNYHG